jgi:hypothetical protein
MNILDNNPGDLPQIDPQKNYLEELVGDGKKFKSPEELARGKAEADMYIEHMKQRQDELRSDYAKLRDEYNAGPKLKETLDQYMQELKQSQGTTNPLGQQEDKSVLDEAKLSDIVKQHLIANKQLEKEENNAAAVESKLQEAYGTNYKQLVKQQIDQLGLSVEYFNDLARKHPAVLYRTLGLEGQRQQENFQTPPSSTRGSDPFGGAKKRTESFYQEIRKNDPMKYRDPKTQDQMFKDAQEQGEAFFDMRDLSFR